jgi:membrane protease YdiL (CAAX protease family)
MNGSIAIRATSWPWRHPLFCFFTLAFMLTWANWVPRALVSHGLIDVTVPDFMAPVAGYGPALAAIVLTGVISGRAGLLRLGKRLCRWRVGIRWYAVALFLPAAQAFTALGLHLLFGGELHRPSEVPTLQVVPLGTPLWLKALLLILMFTLGFDGLGEEVGWRGFALPRLLARYPALGASLVLGAIWALWHLPYALTEGSAMADRPFYAYLPQMFATSIHSVHLAFQQHVGEHSAGDPFSRGWQCDGQRPPGVDSGRVCFRDLGGNRTLDCSGRGGRH